MGGSELLVVDKKGLDLTMLDFDAVFEGLGGGVVVRGAVEETRVVDYVAGVVVGDSGQCDLTEFDGVCWWATVSSGH